MSLATSNEEVKILNETLFEKLASHDSDQVKQAEDAVNDYTRTQMREDGIFRRIMPPVPVDNSDLTRSVGSDKPAIVVDLEPDSPAAISVGFATLPQNLYVEANRYEVLFDRIITPKFTKDVSELRTWNMDIRQIISDNAIKDMLAEEDSKFLRAVDSAVAGPNAVVATSGVVQYQVLDGGISRDSLWDSFKILPNTPSSLEAHTILCNHITILDVAKFGRDEMGGDMSGDIMRNGWSYKEFMGKKWVITIKKGLVPTNTMYHFADPKFIGKSFSLEDATMFVERKAFQIEFFAYSEQGATIGNTSSVARVDFVA